MRTWLKRARAALGLGLLWAVGGVAIAAVLELLDNVMPAAHPLTRLVDMWPQTLALLGFLSGTLFGAVLGIAASRRRFGELSMPLFTTLGAVAGLVLGIVLRAPAPILGVLTVASAVGGASSLALARRAERRELSGAGARVPEVERTAGESRFLPPE